MKINLFLFKRKEDTFSIPSLEHYEWKIFNETDFVQANASPYEIFSKFMHLYKPLGFYTVGPDSILDKEFSFLNQCSYIVKRLWVHLENFDSFDDTFPPNNIFTTIHKHRYAEDNPLLSIITSTFHSGEKILRPLRSLQAQSYTNWEWILWDDSKDSKTYEELLKMAEKDYRIHVFKAPQPSGYIGEMKRLAAGCAKGEWLVEVDHDDDLHENLLEWIVQASKDHPDVNFIYTDSTEVYENGTCHYYGDNFAFGFGANVNCWKSGRWYTQIVTQGQNPRTMSHIVGVPNHVRAWKTTFYDSIGKHNPLLSVGDDYELLVRSFLKGKWLHIPLCGYFQYRNDGGNNFTFLRNALIQHNVHWTYEKYKLDILKHFQDIGTPLESPLPYGPCWYVDQDHFPRNEVYWLPKPFDTKTTISIILPTYNRPEDMKTAVHSILDQTDTDWILYIVGDRCPTLEKTMDSLTKELLCNPQKRKFLAQINWWNLGEQKHMWGAVSRNYGLKMLCKTDWVTYLDDDNSWTPYHLSSLRKTSEENPEATYILSSFLVEGKEIQVTKPEFGRVDASSFMHKRKLAEKYGYWPMTNVGYANDWDFVKRWAKETFAVTQEATLLYNTKYNEQTYESILQLAKNANVLN
jgi:glycosyltransferase involved in cell wall biosynthesis